MPGTHLLVFSHCLNTTNHARYTFIVGLLSLFEHYKSCQVHIYWSSLTFRTLQIMPGTHLLVFSHCSNTTNHARYTFSVGLLSLFKHYKSCQVHIYCWSSLTVQILQIIAGTHLVLVFSHCLNTTNHARYTFFGLLSLFEHYKSCQVHIYWSFLTVRTLQIMPGTHLLLVFSHCSNTTNHARYTFIGLLTLF